MTRDGSSAFPPPESADASGLVAVTDKLTVDLLRDAYYHGIFPWSEKPVRWYSPEPRAVFLWQTVHLPRRLERTIRTHAFRVTFDIAFPQVMRGCATAHAHQGVWISTGFITAYTALHERGDAHSVEVWQGEQLVGGLYGVQVGRVFCGESMFHTVPNASKVAFAFLVRHLQATGTALIDAQVINNHTASLGAVVIGRSDYLAALAVLRTQPTPFAGQKWPHNPGAWQPLVRPK